MKQFSVFAGCGKCYTMKDLQHCIRIGKNEKKAFFCVLFKDKNVRICFFRFQK